MPSTSTRARVFIGVIVLAAGAGLAACGSDEDCERVAGVTVCGSAAPLSIPPGSEATDYIRLSPSPAPDGTDPYVTGKLVVVAREERGPGHVIAPGTIDTAVMWQMDQDGYGDLTATVENAGRNVADPAEIGTVVWIDCSEISVATYSNGGVGYQTTCTATVIDKERNVVVGQKTVSARPPRFVSCPQTEPQCGPFFGDVDLAGSVASWLEHLPHQPR